MKQSAVMILLAVFVAGGCVGRAKLAVEQPEFDETREQTKGEIPLLALGMKIPFD